MRSVCFSAAAAAATMVLGAMAGCGSAGAGEMTFRLTNRSASPVWVEFYSRDRLKQWPDDGRLFILADSSPMKFTVPCEMGEQICYGAWEEGDISHYWGAGYEGKQDCDDCCQVCEAASKMPVYQIGFQ